ncbi:MAG: hypothetical protein ACRD0P_10085 [Stackebrandtia sp.]
MIEGAIRLNRFGLERGKLWPAILMAIAVFAPLITWTTANSLVSGEEELPRGYKIVLTGTPAPMAPPGTGTVTLTIPHEGWSIDASSASTDEVTLVHNPLTLRVTAVAGVKDLKRLFSRQKRDLADEKPALFVTDAKPYSASKKLEGLWGDLTGERYGGALVVVGKGTAAAVIKVTAPLGQLDGEFSDISDIMASMEVTT